MSTIPQFESLEGRKLFSGVDSSQELLHRIDVGNSPSYPQIVNVVNGRVIFSSEDANRHSRLYTFDPQSDSAVLLGDISTDNVLGKQGAVIGNEMYFQGVQDGRWKLFKTDGTPQGTVVVSLTTYSLAEGVVFKGKLYFSDGGLKVLDPADDSIQRIDSNPAGNLSWIAKLTVVGDHLFFEGAAGYYPRWDTTSTGKTGVELWVSDGTSAGTHLVKDLNPARPTMTTGDSDPSFLTDLNGLLVYTASTTGSDSIQNLYISDGTADGTQLISANRVTNLVRMGNYVYFESEGALWKTDGTAEGTTEVSNAADFSTPIIVMGDHLYLQGEDSSRRDGLWSSDGTSQGTTLVKVIDGGSIAPIAAINGVLYCAGDDDLGSELWQSDGTESGTFMIEDLNPGSENSYPEQFTLAGDKIYFIGFTQATGDSVYWMQAPVAPEPSVPTVPPSSPPSSPPASPPPPPAPVVTVPPESSFVQVSNHLLAVQGTTGGDRITLRHKAGDANILQVVRNGKISNFTFSDVQKINVTASNGNDFVDLRDISIGATILGGNGNDSICGSDGADRIDGGRGDDYLYGMAGNDSITGGIGHDVIRGGDGTDRLVAEVGIDDTAKNKGDALIKVVD